MVILEAHASCLLGGTLPGELMRSRHSFGMLQQLQIDEAVAFIRADCVQVSVGLGLDPKQRRARSEKISERMPLLVDGRSVAGSLEVFFRCWARQDWVNDESQFRLWPAAENQG